MKGEREYCASCDKRRVVSQWHHVGGVVMGLLFPVCQECAIAGWKPQEGRDYESCSEEEFHEEAVKVLGHAVRTGQI